MGEIEIRHQDVQQADGPARLLTVEDVLRADVLAAIAAGAPDAPVLASAALRTDQLDFPRWYA